MTDGLLALSYTLHLIATVTWIGGLVLLTLIVWPGLVVREGAAIEWLARLRRRFYPLANLSLVVLIVTGLYQMTRNRHYEGFLQIDSDWTRAIFVKHIAVLGMIVMGGVMQWGVVPALDRATMLVKMGKAAPDLDRLLRRERQLAAISAVLGILTLICTAIATSIV
ncbi:MAG TPA: CopD family protein [Aggregatilineales bacterium]|nr:CopD family protein [Aggregatilineales bacterium]